MTEIPKIVRQRLAMSPKPGPHPDADLLTAFAEQSLANRERDSVLTHLSQCAECREVVFLAAPQFEAAVETVPVRSHWLGWPALRWGALAACAVVVVGAVSLRQRSERMATFIDHTPPKMTAKLDEPPQEQNSQIAASVEKDRGAMHYSGSADAVRRDEKVVNTPQSPSVASRARTAAAAPAPIAADEVAVSAGMMGGGATVNQPAASNSTDLARQAESTPPQVNEQVQVTAESATVTTTTDQAVLGKAKQGISGGAFKSSDQRMAAKGELASAAGLAPSAYKKLIPRWTLSSDGTLQRSLDAGKTWTTIPVAASATFTAVAAMASDIWVGGSHGSLYHSSDAGDHWTPVTPASNGQSLTSNIIGIEFADALRGKITTSSQQIWTTADGGQTWQISQ